MIKAIIFDMDGVLIDSEPYQLKQHEAYLSSKGIYLTLDKLNLAVGASPQLRWESIQDMFLGKLTREKYNTEFATFRKNINPNYKGLLNLGALDLLNWLNIKSYKVALASSANMNKIQVVLEQCGIKNYFEVILSGEMFKHSKPNPEIYLTMAKKLNLNPWECLAVEDSMYGITAAKTAGMYTVALEENRFGFDQSSADVKILNLLELKKILKNKFI